MLYLRKTRGIRKELMVKIIHAREHRAEECSKEEVSRVRCKGEARRCSLGQDEPLDLVLGGGRVGGGDRGGGVTGCLEKETEKSACISSKLASGKKEEMDGWGDREYT